MILHVRPALMLCAFAVLSAGGCVDYGWETTLSVPLATESTVDLTSAQYEFDLFRDGSPIRGNFKRVKLGVDGLLELTIGEFPAPGPMDAPRPDRVLLLVAHDACEETIDLPLSEETMRDVRVDGSILVLELNEPLVIEDCEAASQ